MVTVCCTVLTVVATVTVKVCVKVVIVVEDNGEAKVNVLALVPVVVSVKVKVDNTTLVVTVAAPNGVDVTTGTIWHTANDAVTDEQLEMSLTKPFWS